MPNSATMFSLSKLTIAPSKRSPRILGETILVTTNCATMINPIHQASAINRLHQPSSKIGDSTLPPTRNRLRQALLKTTTISTFFISRKATTWSPGCNQTKKELYATSDFRPNLRKGNWRYSVMAIQPQQKRYLKILIIVLVIWLGVIPLSLVAINAIVARNRKPGPERTTVPQLVGLDQKAADAKARGAKLNMQVLMTRSDQPGTPGTILFQTPAAGESVEVGTFVGVSGALEHPDPQTGEDKRRQL